LGFALAAALTQLLAACGGGGGGGDAGTVQPSQVPVAVFSTQASGPGYSFDASQSYDTNGQIDNYEWEFGDGSTARGQQVTHTFQKPGAYPVTLRVTDSEGNSDTVTISVEVGLSGIWQPAPGTSWQIQLDGPLDTSFDVDMYMVDLFDTTQADVALLHERGRVVICHFSAGLRESWRSDATAFPGAVVGAGTGVAGENWLDIRRLDLLTPLMQGRLDRAAQLGCDGVAPDNVDGFSAASGFPLSADDQLGYNRWLSEQAHARNLSVGLANDPEQVVDLIGYYDWAIVERCFQFAECDRLSPFVEAGKAVFGIEYDLTAGAFCPQADQLGLDFLKKKPDLQAWRIACDTQTVNAPPVARFGTTARGGSIDFDAGNSSDDGMIVSYLWDYGDGNTGQGASSVSHTYLADGVYTVVLTVTDDGGMSDTFSLPVNVVIDSNQPPRAQFSVSASTGTAPLVVTFDAASSSDDGGIVGYAWNFGDAGATASGRTAMHTYNQAGSYTATLTVTDDGGLTAAAEKQVFVTAASPPAAIWQPAPGTSWQWQLTGTIDTSIDVDMYDIDLFDTPKSTIDTLHGQGRTVVCYFSAGSWENWRPDAAEFPASVKGRNNGWPGEQWLDISDLDALGPIMQARLDLAADKGCDGVEPDNVDGYTNNTGFPLTGNDQLAYNRWLADQAHARGLSIGLKNDLDQVRFLEPDFDWALNEQCFEYDECDLLLPFVQAGKAVFGVEYTGSTASFCPAANSMNFDWLKKNLDLDAARQSCR
jgi:chitodextrinase